MFFDNASTTKIDEKIIDKFKTLNEENFYNAGALYKGGMSSKYLIESWRNDMLNLLGASIGKIVFTGSATEANNLAMLGFVKKNTRKILVSMGEHPSVYNTAKELKDRGFNVDFVKLGSDGKIDFEDFKSKMTEDVDFVSIMHVSNETGAINNIKNLVDYAKNINPKIVFHCDGVQAFGKIKVDVEDFGVDMYTVSAHKIHGMKGVGALYIRSEIALKPIIFGGGQESGLRSGTENLLGIYSLVEAGKIAIDNLQNNYDYVSELKNNFLSELDKSIQLNDNKNIKYYLHSCKDNSPYVLSISFDKCRAETILNMLSDKNIFVGNGSACSSKKRGNRVLENMGISANEIEGNLRVSFCKNNTMQEVSILAKELIDCVSEYIRRAR